MKHTSLFIIIIFLAGLLTACSSSNPVSETKSESASTPPTQTPQKIESTDNIPVNVKSALKNNFPQASSFTEQHTKHHDGDLHTYIAFNTASGMKTTLGVATVAEVKGAQYLLVVDNDIKIIKVSVVQSSGNSEVEANAFLDQFVGKTHDDAFKLGKDIQFSGKDKAAAEAVTSSLHHAELDLQELYGKPHTHSH